MFGFVGRYRPKLDEVVVPVVQVGNVELDQEPPPTRRAILASALAGVVGEMPVFRFETPAGVFAIIERINLNPAGLWTFRWGATLAAPATLVTTFGFTDGRLRESGQTPGCRVAHDTYVGGIATYQYRFRLSGRSGALSTDQLAPMWTIGRRNAADFLEIGLNVANTTIEYSMQWVEVAPFA
jgi:hypothetical protein